MKKNKAVPVVADYRGLVGGISELLESARHNAVRVVNALMTAIYWEIGRRIVEFEQHGKERAEYGAELLDKLSVDLTRRFGRGFGRRNLFQIRAFHLAYPRIVQTVSAQSQDYGTKVQTVSAKSATPLRKSDLSQLASVFQLPWSHYVRLLSVNKSEARSFYETEALRGGWSVRQLDRQINSQFYERTALSRNKAAMLKKGVSGSALKS